jgi:hypothetical protein
MTVGTSAGFMATYDLRYGVTSALYQNDLELPVLAFANHK